MSELLTFGEAKQARELKVASGVCTTSSDFLGMLNQAVRKLVNRGPGERAFWGTVKRIQICSDSNEIVWPSFVGTPLAVNTYGGTARMVNGWYDFMPFYKGDFNCGAFSYERGCCSGNVVVAAGDTTPVVRNVPCGSKAYIRIYPQRTEDIGKVVTIYGVDQYGQVLRTQKGTEFTDGINIVVGNPFGSTAAPIQRIDRIVKPVTVGDLRMFLYIAESNQLFSAAIYGPNEISPVYRTSRIHGRLTNCSQCNGLFTLQAMVKLAFIPVKADNDLVLVSNLDAIAAMIRSIREDESGDKEASAAFEAEAIHELNLELEDKFPLDQTIIDVLPFGSALPARARIGRII